MKKNVPINRPILKKKAKSLSYLLNKADFESGGFNDSDAIAFETISVKVGAGRDSGPKLAVWLKKIDWSVQNLWCL